MNSDAEIKLLQTNMKELQGQLNTAHNRISELIKEKATAYDDLQKEKEYAKGLAEKLIKMDNEASELIQKKMDDIPDVIDSKPISYKRPPQPGYSVKEGEKWVSIKDGKMEYEDIEIKK